MSPSAGLVLVPLSSDPSLNTRCGGIYSLISLFRIAASSTPLLVFWDELCYHPPTAVWSAYTTIQGGLMWCGVYQVGYTVCAKNNQQPTTPSANENHHNHDTKCKRRIKMEEGGILCCLMSYWGVVVGGKTSHLFLGGEDGWWYQVSGTWCT